MSDEALILRNDSALTIIFTPQAEALKEQALSQSARIGKVTDSESNGNAVEAQTNIARLLKLVEEARVAAKDPVLRFGKTIDTQAKVFIEELKAEEWRVSRLVGDFAQLEAAKARAAQAAENERLSALEREKAKELAKATSHEQMEDIREKFGVRAEQEAPRMIAPPRAQGQVVKEDWEVTVNDIWTLARAHPSCVKIEPMVSQIKALLNAGVKVAGVTAAKTMKSQVRLAPERKAIEIT